MNVKKLELIANKYGITSEEQLETLIKKGTIFDQISWERNCAREQLKEIGCDIGCSMESINRELTIKRDRMDRISILSPVNFGDKVYYIDEASKKILNGVVIRFIVQRDKTILLVKNKQDRTEKMFTLKRYGMDWFLTKKDAKLYADFSSRAV